MVKCSPYGRMKSEEKWRLTNLPESGKADRETGCNGVVKPAVFNFMTSMANQYITMMLLVIMLTLLVATDVGDVVECKTGQALCNSEEMRSELGSVLLQLESDSPGKFQEIDPHHLPSRTSKYHSKKGNLRECRMSCQQDRACQGFKYKTQSQMCEFLKEAQEQHAARDVTVTTLKPRMERIKRLSDVAALDGARMSALQDTELSEDSDRMMNEVRHQTAATAGAAIASITAASKVAAEKAAQKAAGANAAQKAAAENARAPVQEQAKLHTAEMKRQAKELEKQVNRVSELEEQLRVSQEQCMEHDKDAKATTVNKGDAVVARTSWHQVPDIQARLRGLINVASLLQGSTCTSDELPTKDQPNWSKLIQKDKKGAKCPRGRSSRSCKGSFDGISDEFRQKKPIAGVHPCSKQLVNNARM